MAYTEAQIKNVDMNGEATKKFLKMDPKTLKNRDERDLWYKIKARQHHEQRINKDYFYKVTDILGYDTSFIGYRDNETKTVISRYSPSYAKKKNEQEGTSKYVSYFKTADTYNNYKEKIISEQDNFGFIQKDMSDVLWIDLDCHDDSLINEYNKIVTIFGYLLSTCSISETKNNHKGTHIWVFLSEATSQQKRKEYRDLLVLYAHINLKIDLDICKKIIDYPRSWFRVPGSKDYKSQDDTLFYYKLYNDIQENRKDPLTQANFENLKKEVFKVYAPQDKKQSIKKTATQGTSQENFKDNVILSNEDKKAVIERVTHNGLSKHNSFEEMTVIMPYLIQKHGKQSVEFFVNMVKAFGDGNGTAEILFNEEELKSRIQYFIDNHKLYLKENWRKKYLTDEQKEIEKFALDLFIKENLKICETNNINRQTLLDLIDSILDKYMFVKPPFKFANLCGNLSATSIIKELKLEKKIFGICTKIQNLFSNLYGFYQVVDEQGKFYIPGRVSTKFICCKNGYILTGEEIYPQISDSILEFKEIIKYVKINNLKPKQAFIKSINEDINYISLEPNENAKNLLNAEKKSILKEYNPTGVRKTKAERQKEAEDKEWDRICKSFGLNS